MRKLFTLFLSIVLILCLSVSAAAAAEKGSVLLSAAGQESAAQTETSVAPESAEEPSDSEAPEFNPLPMYMGGLFGGALIGILMVKGSRGSNKIR